MPGSTADPFGSLLRRLRQRRHLTQQQLATAIGLHRTTIGRWEDGSVLPESKALVLDLAGHLYLDDQETRQLLEASLTALAPYWHVPLPRNPFFTGRAEILEALHTELGTNQAVALTHSSALQGLGGIGKTQIALEYAYRHVLEYSAVFWIGAETEETMLSSLLGIANVLQLPERNEQDLQRVVTAVGRWLSTHGQWLLIWDNVEDLDRLARFLPKARAGAMLLTTRHGALGPLARGIDLLPMDQEEGRLFLLRRAKLLVQEAGREQVDQLAQRLPTEYAAASELVTKVGQLPLALDQIGAYCEETGCSLSDYLRHYEHHQTRLLGRRGSFGSDHPHSVSTTFRLAIEQVEREQQAAADVLRICALVQAEAIPEELFGEGAAFLGPNLADFATDFSRLDQAMTVLRHLSLLQRHPETHTLSIHRLVQVVVGDWMSEQERIRWLRRLIGAFNALFPDNAAEAHAWKQCERLLAHVLTVTAALPASTGGLDLVEVLCKAADYLQERAQYERAEQVYRQAIHRGEQHLAPNHPALAPALSGLALLLVRQGTYEQAEALGRQAVSLSEQALGRVHPQVAASLTTLAILYSDQGKYALAEPLLERSISIWEQTLGQDHPQIAFPLNRLAHLYWKQGNYAQAEPLFQRALAIWQQAYGPESHQVAQPLYDLALLYWKTGYYKQAKPLFMRALAIWQQAYGPEHPLVAYALRGLAILHTEQGDYAQAERLYQQELHIWQQVWGPEHYQVTLSLMNLGEAYAKQGKDTQAEPLLHQVWQAAERVWGPEHLQVSYPMRTLAQIYVTRGNYAQAESLFQRVIQIREQALGPEHPSAATVCAELGHLWLIQGKDEQAREILQRVLACQEQRPGPHHPETAYTLYSLALLQQKQNNLSEALSLVQRARSICSQSLGETHPQIVATRTLYERLLRQQADVQEEVTAEGSLEARNGAKVPSALPEEARSSASKNGPLQAFLDACCELHPRAWCRSADLWQAYEQWARGHQEPFPLSRGAFIAQLKAHGCHADRTMTARIWRGIALVKQDA